MLTFYRRIRQGLLGTGATRKYLLYAIGEILLVVIGILIALQINNWNLNRIASKKESLLLAELHEEFVRNKAQFETVNDWHLKGMNATQNIIDMFPIKIKEIDLDSLELYYMNTAWRYSFNPSQGVIKSIVNTSSFEIITNNRLRQIIISWTDVLNDYLEEENRANDYVTYSLVPFYEEHLDWDGNFKDERNNLSVLSTLKFESLLKQRRNDLNDILGATDESNEIQEMMNQIIKLSRDKNQ